MIHIQEVVSRDGLQNEPDFVPTDQKVELINRLSQTGVNKIEVTSFVSPKAVPNLKDAAEVMKRIDRNPDVTYAALIPNLKGAERAVESGVDEVNLLVSASDTHNLKNVRRKTKETFDSFQEIIDYLSDYDVALSGAIGTSFGCPFEGDIPEERVLESVRNYVNLGVKRITLADTTGMATPKLVYERSKAVLEEFPDVTFTLHFHNTRGMGLANVLEGIRAGITHFDASLGGIGGCPFAPGASGNICTEDLVHMLHFMDYDMTVDLDRLIETSKYLQTLLSHPLDGQIVKAGKITDLHSVETV